MLSLAQPGTLGSGDGFLFRRDPIALSDGRYFGRYNSIGSMGMVSLNFMPVELWAPRPGASVARLSDGKDSLALRDLPSRTGIYAGGEVGVLYGRSSGKYGGDEFQSYIFGSVGNERFQITAGAAYQESTFRYPRRTR